MATTGVSGNLPMTQFAVFFSDPAAIGLQRVEAAETAESWGWRWISTLMRNCRR